MGRNIYLVDMKNKDTEDYEELEDGSYLFKGNLDDDDDFDYDDDEDDDDEYEDDDDCFYTNAQARLIFDEIKKQTAVTAVEIVADIVDKNKPLLLTDSKFGGLPYWQDGMEYPTAKDDGTKLVLLAQINFGQMPHLDDFPESGILQFFIKPDDIYGCDFDNRNYDRWRPVYHENIGEPMSEEALRAMGVTTAEEVKSFPLSPEFALSFEKQESFLNMTCEDLFEREVRRIAPKLNLPVPDENTPFYDFFSDGVRDDFNDECEFGEHLIGGYPSFAQYDPRQSDDDKDVLLLQINSWGNGDEGDGEIMWGDCGIGNFFISRDDLKKRDFSRVLYNWDCY